MEQLEQSCCALVWSARQAHPSAHPYAIASQATDQIAVAVIGASCILGKCCLSFIDDHI